MWRVLPERTALSGSESLRAASGGASRYLLDRAVASSAVGHSGDLNLDSAGGVWAPGPVYRGQGPTHLVV